MAHSSSPFKVGFAAILAQSLVATAAFQISDSSELFLNGTAAIRFDDNIYQTGDNEVDDVIFMLSPGVELKAGTEGASYGEISYNHDILVYADNDDNNSALANFQAMGSINTAKSSLKASAFFRQLEGNTQDFLGSRFGDLVKRDNYGGDIKGETQATAKIKVGGGVEARAIDYDAAFLADQTVISVPVNVYYASTPKLDLSGGYEYRTTDLGDRLFPDFTTIDPNDTIRIPSEGTDSHFFNVGARGELAPKLTADFRVGAELRDGGAGDDWTMAIDGTFNWAASEKTNYRLLLGRRFDTAGTGQGYTRTNVGIQASHAFTDQIRGTGQFRYELSEYDVADRSDDYFEFSIGGSYLVNQNLSLSAGYIFRFSNSSEDVLEFTNNVASVSATFRY